MLDRGYVQHVCVTVVSLLANNPGCKFFIHCLHDGASAEDWEKLEKTVQGRNCELRSIRLEEDFSTSHHFKLVIPDYIEEERVLYLDSDMVVAGSIEEIYQQDFEDTYLLAVEDMTAEDYRDRPYMSPEAKFFNAGVMLFNLPRWREERLGQRALEWIKSSPFPYDQEGFNAVVNGNWKPLPLKYNQQTLIFHPRFVNVPEQRNRFPDSELQEAKTRPVIVHYTGLGHKPWRLGNRHPFWWLYWRYLWMTPYRFTLPEAMSLPNILRSFLPDSIRVRARQLSAFARKLLNR